MKLSIKSTNLEITPAISEYIEKKIGSLDKFLKRFNAEGGVLTQVEISRTTKHHYKGDVFYAEINLHLPHKSMRGEATSEDIRYSINMAREKIQHQIQKYLDTLAS